MSNECERWNSLNIFNIVSFLFFLVLFSLFNIYPWKNGSEPPIKKKKWKREQEMETVSRMTHKWNPISCIIIAKNWTGRSFILLPVSFTLSFSLFFSIYVCALFLISVCRQLVIRSIFTKWAWKHVYCNTKNELKITHQQLFSHIIWS